MADAVEAPNIRDRHEKPEENEIENETSHARRPMNAFLIFCKRHRGVVRNKYPNLENRQITKILGEWWANLEKDEKSSYTGLAKQYKDAFFDAHPDFKWYKIPAPPKRSLETRPGNNSTTNVYIESENGESDVVSDAKSKASNNNNNNDVVKINFNIQATTSKSDGERMDGARPTFTPGKLADETQMGGLSSLILSKEEENEDIEKNYSYSTNLIIEQTSDQTVNDFEDVPPKKQRFHDEMNHNESTDCDAAEDLKLQKLQDELSKTSRILELSFDSDTINDKQTRSSELFSDCTPELKYDSPLKNVGINNNKHNDIWSSSFRHIHNKNSGRTCKGKRYQEFMALGGLVVNKRSKRELDCNSFNVLYSQQKKFCELKSESKNCDDKDELENECCIKSENRLAKNCTLDSLEKNEKSASSELVDTGQGKHSNNENSPEKPKEKNHNVESRALKASDFNLDAKIKALPSLSLEKFLQRKKENKKRRKTFSFREKDTKAAQTATNASHNHSTNKHKVNHDTFSIEWFKPKTEKDSNNRPSEILNELSANDKIRLAEEHKSIIIGSRKRKPRKISITRLNVNSDPKTQQNSYIEGSAKIFHAVPILAKGCFTNSHPHNLDDNFGLATLAEVAAKLQN